MVGWYHRCNRHKLGQTPGNGEGQGGLACCSPWGSQRVGHDWVTEQDRPMRCKQTRVVGRAGETRAWGKPYKQADEKFSSSTIT